MSSRLRQFQALCCACVGLAVAADLLADEHRARIKVEYQLAEGLREQCPDAQALQREISGRLGYDPFDPQATTTVRVQVRSVGKRMEADVERIGANNKVLGKRKLEAARDCRELVDAAALAIAMAIDARATVSHAQPAASSAGSAEPPPPPPPPGPSAVPAATPSVPAAASDPVRSASSARAAPSLPSTPPQWQLSAGVLGSVGTSPGAAFGVSALVGLRWLHWSLGVEGRADPVVRTITEGNRSGSTGLLIGTLVPCVHASPWMGCAVLSLGSLYARGEGFDNSRQTNFIYSSVGVRGGAVVPIGGRLHLQPYGDLRAALSQITLQMNGRDVWSNSTLSFAFGLNFGVTL